MRYMLLLPIVWIGLFLTSSASQNQPKSTVQQLSSSSHTQAGEFRAEPSPERLARGRYIVEGPAHCFECHSEPDFKNALGQPRPGTKGAGQIIKNEAYNGEPFPDGLVCPNITPDKETGAGAWTDAQFERALRHGIGHDGRQLMDYMPYAFFRSMTDEDVASVIVYIRSLPAIRNALPKTKMPFDVKLNLHPEMEPTLPPDATEQVRRGWYLVRIAQCNDCHTSADEKGNAQTELMFGGGQRLVGAWGDVVSANISTHPSGISYYDETMFIKTIHTGNSSGGVRELNHLMPFSYFRNMTDEDLKSIFAFLQSVKLVKHYLDNSEPPTYCRLCRQNHGFGDKN